MRLNGSDILVECLVEQGVDTVFGYPGGAVLNIYDALYKNKDRIKHILTSHEQGASHAADGYARTTKKVGVCIATSGPGATNTVTGIATAYMDSVPMVVITGNVGLALLGKDSFQEVDITGITTPITKHNYIVKDVNLLADTIREAFYIASSGRPGPVLIDIPKNVSAEFAEYTYVKPREIIRSTFRMKENDIVNVANIINQAKRPFIYAGGGVNISGASAELLEFANKLNAPVSTSLMGIGAFPANHELSTGLIGMHGSQASNIGASTCDCLIAIGARFSDRIVSDVKNFAKNAKIVHIDIDPAEIGKNVKVSGRIIGDVKEVLIKLTPLINNQSLDYDWLEKNKQLRENKNKCYKDEENLTPKFIMEELDKATKNDAIVTTEVGQHQMWAAQFYQFNKPNTLITSGGLGTMGYGMGAAIGASVGNPGKTICHIAGDGSFRMNFNELSTVKYYDLPIITVIMNNEVLGMVRQWQTAFYEKRYSESVLDRGPNFNKLADAFEINNYDIYTKEEFVKAIDEAVKSKKAAVLNCHIAKDDKVLPMVAPGAAIDNLILE